MFPEELMIEFCVLSYEKNHKNLSPVNTVEHITAHFSVKAYYSATLRRYLCDKRIIISLLVKKNHSN